MIQAKAAWILPPCLCCLSHVPGSAFHESIEQGVKSKMASSPHPGSSQRLRPYCNGTTGGMQHSVQVTFGKPRQPPTPSSPSQRQPGLLMMLPEYALSRLLRAIFACRPPFRSLLVVLLLPTAFADTVKLRRRKCGRFCTWGRPCGVFTRRGWWPWISSG